MHRCSSCLCRYTLLQVFSKFGKIAKLDFLFHKSGPMKGKPRGYAFVEYSNKDVRPFCHLLLQTLAHPGFLSHDIAPTNDGMALHTSMCSQTRGWRRAPAPDTLAQAAAVLLFPRTRRRPSPTPMTSSYGAASSS